MRLPFATSAQVDSVLSTASFVRQNVQPQGPVPALVLRRPLRKWHWGGGCHRYACLPPAWQGNRTPGVCPSIGREVQEPGTHRSEQPRPCFTSFTPMSPNRRPSVRSAGRADGRRREVQVEINFVTSSLGESLCLWPCVPNSQCSPFHLVLSAEPPGVS